jgi:AraC-like DNA-binding protein
MPRAMHSHDDILELILITGGTGIHKIGGRTYETKEKDLLIYDAGVPHDEVFPAHENLEVYCIGIKNLRITGKKPGVLSDGENFVIKTRTESHIESGDGCYRHILSMFELIHSANINSVGYSISGEYLTYLTEALIILVMDLIKSKPLPIKKIDSDRIVKEIKKYLDENFTDELTLEKIAENMHISMYYMSHLFKEKEGISPMQYVIRRRIGEAQSLLIGTAKTVTDIALTVGYKNPNHFQSAFLKAVGMPPRYYRSYWVSNIGQN